MIRTQVDMKKGTGQFSPLHLHLREWGATLLVAIVPPYRSPTATQYLERNSCGQQADCAPDAIDWPWLRSGI